CFTRSRLRCISPLSLHDALPIYKQFLFEGYSTSGRPLTYESSNNSVATIAGNIVTIHAAGTTEIKATQNENRFFMEAEPVFQTLDRKSTRLNSSHVKISYAVFCL